MVSRKNFFQKFTGSGFSYKAWWCFQLPQIRLELKFLDLQIGNTLKPPKITKDNVQDLKISDFGRLKPIFRVWGVFPTSANALNHVISIKNDYRHISSAKKVYWDQLVSKNFGFFTWKCSFSTHGGVSNFRK